jgi:hypothetical protein
MCLSAFLTFPAVQPEQHYVGNNMAQEEKDVRNKPHTSERFETLKLSFSSAGK